LRNFRLATEVQPLSLLVPKTVTALATEAMTDNKVITLLSKTFFLSLNLFLHSCYFISSYHFYLVHLGW
jgi:hypothetical protein